MKSNHCNYNIEIFSLEPAENAGCKTLVLGGWLHADFPVQTMQLEIPHTELIWSVVDFKSPSHDLVQHFGEMATNKRFSLVAMVPNTDIPFNTARLNVQLQGGDRLSLGVGNIFKSHDGAFQEESRSLVMRFESLGDNCEIGLLQRHHGAERLGLFRFAGTPRCSSLIESIQNRFEGFAAPDDLAFHLLGNEWMATSRRYGFEFHTRCLVEAVTEDQIRELESRHLQFLARMMLEDVEDGHKIFVRRNGRWGGSQPEEGMAELYQALRIIGPARLLWVTLADDHNPPGTVIRRDDGLYRGYIDTLSDYADAYIYSASSWLALMREAIHLIDADSQAASPETSVSEPTPIVEQQKLITREPILTSDEPGQPTRELPPVADLSVQTSAEAITPSSLLTQPNLEQPARNQNRPHHPIWNPINEVETDTVPKPTGVMSWLRRWTRRH